VSIILSVLALSTKRSTLACRVFVVVVSTKRTWTHLMSLQSIARRLS